MGNEDAGLVHSLQSCEARDRPVRRTDAFQRRISWNLTIPRTGTQAVPTRGQRSGCPIHHLEQMTGDSTSVEQDSRSTLDSPEHGFPLEEIDQTSMKHDVHAPGNDLMHCGVPLAPCIDELRTEQGSFSGPLVYQ